MRSTVLSFLLLSLWGGAAALAAWVVCRLLRRAHAPSRFLCWLWLAVGLRFVLPFGIPLALPRPQNTQLAEAADTVQALTQPELTVPDLPAMVPAAPAATPETAEAAEPEATPTPAPTQAPTAVVNTAQLPLLEDPANSPRFIDPVPDYKYISRFMGNGHRGDDLCAAPGTDVLAAADGVVVQAAEHYSFGNFVVIDHGTNGEGYSWRTLYAHLQSYTVEAGQSVTQGQVIGYVGSTGRTTGNQCHFEVYVDNTLTSPRWFTAYHGEGHSAEPTDEERQELIDQCVDAKLNDAMYTMDEALDGQGAQAVVFSLPLVLSDDVRMSSTFAQNHTGVDLAAPEGTTVLAAADGTVTEYDYNEDDGYYLVLYHGMDDGTSWQTRYSHLGSVKVQVGQQVVQGQEIAACGSTGASTGPHLHWEVLKNSEPVDPQTVCELLSTL